MTSPTSDQKTITSEPAIRKINGVAPSGKGEVWLGNLDLERAAAANIPYRYGGWMEQDYYDPIKGWQRRRSLTCCRPESGHFCDDPLVRSAAEHIRNLHPIEDYWGDLLLAAGSSICKAARVKGIYTTIHTSEAETKEADFGTAPKMRFLFCIETLETYYQHRRLIELMARDADRQSSPLVLRWGGRYEYEDEKPFENYVRLDKWRPWALMNYAVSPDGAAIRRVMIDGEASVWLSAPIGPDASETYRETRVPHSWLRYMPGRLPDRFDSFTVPRQIFGEEAFA